MRKPQWTAFLLYWILKKQILFVYTSFLSYALKKCCMDVMRLDMTHSSCLEGRCCGDNGRSPQTSTWTAYLKSKNLRNISWNRVDHRGMITRSRHCANIWMNSYEWMLFLSYLDAFVVGDSFRGSINTNWSTII